ncbi:hypothetical protein vBSbQDWS_24 [Shewanella phage vB_Sb_QDWS]|nr:hypothetical protein vBSbQDWS_24 [Shewanella phage vB_Sb_QDWS]
MKAPLPGVPKPIEPGAANVAPPSVAALTAELQANPVPDVYVSALDDVEQLGSAVAVGDAIEPVTFASTLFAACVARSPVVTRPVAVSAPVIVGEAIVGDVDRTALPVPVALVAPVPPLAGVSGFCSVSELNVGLGYVWASAIAGTRRAVRRIFLIMVGQEMEMTPSLFQTTPFALGGLVGRSLAQAVLARMVLS